ncbi:MAG TPA: molecular chaperone HtpG [Kiritimatiellia bacterium]|nr:molecular chaperone HtpG [Kiritimatiellia bacterium]
MSLHTRTFKTEVRQLLDLVIHSLYSKKEIFLRELISNASDAIDRARFEALTHKDIQRPEDAWEIRITLDKTARTLTVSDNGIGMTADEVEANIGTIANSGTRRFLESLQANPDAASRPELIGQFGVGFYASFMVADRVEVITRRAGSEAPATRWISSGEDTYTLEEAERADFGTDIILHLREDQDDFLSPWRIKSVVKQYSDYIGYPVKMLGEAKPAKEGEEALPPEDETLNSRKAIWKKAPADVTQAEYNEFYHHVSHDFSDPLHVIHYSAEGVTEFKALLFLPEKPPFDLYLREGHRGIHLYVRNVFITDDCRALLPEYLRFVQGVVDSSDLPLNVSREMLQDDALIRKIRKSLVGKVLNTLADLKEKNFADYLKFYRSFGAVLKEGIHTDFENREKLTGLLLYPSTTSEPDRPVSFKEYVERMPQDQKAVYVLAADSLRAAQSSPLLEVFRKKNYEVLFWTDPIDEWVGQSLTEVEGKKIQPIDRGDLDLGPVSEEETKAREEAAKEHEGLLAAIKSLLGEDIKEVRFSSRLTDSACCLVADEHGLSASMERLMQAMNKELPPSQRILELNPAHPVVAKMDAMHKASADDPQLKDYAELLYGQALLLEGSPLKDPAAFTQRLARLMA